MYRLKNQLVDVLWFEGVMGVVKARDPITEQTKRYVGIAQGLHEIKDIEHILDYGQKIEGERILDLERRFKPYANFKRTDYEAGDEILSRKRKEDEWHK